MNVFRTVRFRLAIWNVGVIMIVLAIFGYSLQLKIRTDLLAGVDDNLDRAEQSIVSDGLRTFLFRHGEAFPPSGLTNEPLAPRAPSATSSTTTAPTSSSATLSLYPFSLLESNGEPAYRDHPALDTDDVERVLGGDEVKKTVTYLGQPWRVLSTPYEINRKVAYVVQFGRPLAPVYIEINRITSALLTLIPLAVLIVGAGALLLTERALRPVREIVRATEGIEASDLSGRLNDTGTDEFSHLASTINNMLGRLDKAFRLLNEANEQQRRFTADASHELRTPLTIIKANTSLAMAIERTPDEYLRTIEAVDRAADRMARIVQDLLYIARSDSGQLFLKSEPVDLRCAVKQAVEAIADLKGHVIKQDGLIEGLTTLGDEDTLIRLFTNLLQNASNYTPAGGLISIRSYAHDGWTFVAITDTGIGIAPEYVEHLGERFFRVDDARARDQGGTGLGLAICRSIASTHGGALSIESTLGVGTTVIVKLPSAESAVSDLSHPAYSKGH